MSLSLLITPLLTQGKGQPIKQLETEAEKTENPKKINEKFKRQKNFPIFLLAGID